jgi:hypothetical protein
VLAVGNDEPANTGIGPNRPPAVLSLSPPWPNPAENREVVNMSVDLPEADDIAVQLYDMAGRRVANRSPQQFTEPGRHTISWRLPSLPSGVYFIRVVSIRGASAQSKIVLLR